MILVRVLLKTRAQTRQQEMAQNGNLWKNGRMEEWEVYFVSSMHLLLCYMYEQRMVARTFPFTIFGMKNGAYHFFNKPC